MEDILFCIIIVITHFRDSVTPVMDVIDVIGDVNYWGKFSVVSRVSSTH